MKTTIAKITSNKIIQNFGLVVLSRFLNAGLYLAFTLSLMKVLSKEEYGEYGYLYGLAGVVPFFLNLGINKSFTTFTCTEKDQQVFNNYLGLYWKTKLILSACLIVFSILFYFYYNSLLEVGALLCGILFGFSESFKSPAESQRKFDFVSKIVPLRNILLVAFCSVAYLLDVLDLKLVILILMASNFLNVIVIYFYYLKKVAPFSTKTTFSFKVLFSQTKWLFIKELLQVFMARMELFVLTYYIEKGLIATEERAYFSGAFTLCFILPIITNSLTNVLLPEVAQLQGSKHLKKYLNKLKKTLFISIPSSGIFYLAMYVFVTIFFEEKYEASLSLFPIIIISTLFTFYTNNISLIFYREGKLQAISIITASQFVLGFFSCIILTPLYGSMGAVMSLLMVRILGFLIVMIMVKKDLNGNYQKNIT